MAGGLPLFDIMGINISREGGVNLGDEKNTILTKKALLSEVKNISGKEDPASWQMKFGLGVDARLILGAGAEVNFIWGLSPLLKK
jgi:hypothetical protein